MTDSGLHSLSSHSGLITSSNYNQSHFLSHFIILSEKLRGSFLEVTYDDFCS